MKYVIIGAGIAGTSAAETLRTLDPSCDITLVTNEPDPLYARITISQYAAGVVARENLLLRKVEQLEAKQIHFYPNTTVTQVNRSNHLVHTKTEGEEKEFFYDKLLIASGGSPILLNRPGSDATGVVYMYTLKDTDMIREFLKGKTTAIVSGGAFIGIDFLNVFLAYNMRIDFLIRGPRFLHKMLDEDASNIIHRIIKAKGVNIRTNEEITAIIPNDNHFVQGIQTNQTRIPCDVVGIGHGIDRKRGFITALGIPLNGGIITNEYLQTIDPCIYAAGDIARYYDLRFQRYALSSDWFSARSQGVTVAKNMAGKILPYEELVSNTTNVFGVSATVVGIVDDPSLTSYHHTDGNKYIKIFTREDKVVGGIVIGVNDYAFKLKLAIKEGKKMTSVAM